MLSDKKFGLSVNLMATKVMPSLLPQTVNPSLNLEQFTILLEVLQEMLDQIDRNQRNKLKLDNLSLPSPERHRPLRHQYSSDNMHVPPFNIPNLRIEQRKTSSAEDMARKNSAGTYKLLPILLTNSIYTFVIYGILIVIQEYIKRDTEKIEIVCWEPNPNSTNVLLFNNNLCKKKIQSLIIAWSRIYYLILFNR